MEWIMSAKCRTGEILLGGHSMGKNSGYSLYFLEIYENLFPTASYNLLCQYAR